MSVGDSIAVNGVCLTIIDISRNTFTATVSKETLKTTNFSRCKVGQKVNLERALSFNGRLSGHIVLGHVDGIVKIVEKRVNEKGYELFFHLPKGLEQYVVLKGSVTLDGVSLTVANLYKDGFSVFLIPHSAQNTNLVGRQIGDEVNIEVDIIAKYLEGLLKGTPVTSTEQVFIDSGILPMGIVDN